MRALYLTAARDIEEFYEELENGHYSSRRSLDASLNLLTRLEELPQNQTVLILITHLHLLLSEHKLLSLHLRKMHLRQGISHARVTPDPVTRKLALKAEQKSDGVFYTPD